MALLGRGLATAHGGRIPFGIDTVTPRDRPMPVVTRDRLALDFGVLVDFRRPETQRQVLVVAPLAGGYAILLRDLVVGLLRHACVAVTDWRDARYVPVPCGHFGLEENIAYVVAMMRELGPGLHVVGVCQGAVPALAATALLCAQDEAAAPRSLTLIGGPIDPLANPTRVVLASRARQPGWFEANVIGAVAADYPGRGRRVYPASAQWSTLIGYVARHWGSGEVFWKLWLDDGEDPVRFPFARLVCSLMDLPAELVLDVVRTVFAERALCVGAMTALGHQVRPERIRRTGLMTVEGEDDDIAAPGQTYAAHALCPDVPSRLRRHLLLTGKGHFSLFHGTCWRSDILPAMVEFFAAAEAPAGR